MFDKFRCYIQEITHLDDEDAYFGGEDIDDDVRDGVYLLCCS